ncbi:biotin-(acetyl-CoA carboxylase) ligase [Niabella soli DSM 19437]|uniref:Biotin-(Acetyl-CoA carboxylase) ligase n=1 Tax=Niabella soli DSM 19437 TaxID=929713 RepID=W0EZ05_9BACT|nr:biotin-(acetyl-CoA carboxylase) ligase [Niabella soli DSM 19437]
MREGLAYHGMGIFAHEQVAGKGQRGKKWTAPRDQNINLSLIIEPEALNLNHLFDLSALVALTTRAFLAENAPGDWYIKWPNDIYFQDRKAVGMLIENILSGQKWKWAVIGVGININQEAFPAELNRAVSLKQVTGKTYNCRELAEVLATKLIDKINKFLADPDKNAGENLENYNEHLFMKNRQVTFDQGECRFNAVVKGVTRDGKLVLGGAPREEYEFGELVWVF